MRFSFVVGACLALIGCKGKPEHREAPANAHVATTGHHSDIQLPKGDGSAPKKTSGHLSQDTIAKLRALTYPRFFSENHGNDQSVAVLYRTDDHPKLKVTVQIRPCDVGSAKCIPLELDKWKARDDLKEFLPTDLQAAPDTTFEVGTTELDGVPMIYTYQVGMADKDGSFTFSDTYVLYFNDGHNEIRAIAAYADDRPLSRDAMLKMASESDLANIAKAFVDVFTQAWA
jgi:hypothetical protein